MRYERNHRRASGAMDFNATPLVDVIFLLTIFFMLVARFSSAEQVAMELPRPEESQAEVTRIPQRVVINCRLAGPDDPLGRSVLYQIGPNLPEPLAVISDRLATMKRESPEVMALVRADRRLRYADVRVVMRVIAENEIRVLNVAAHVAEGE